MKNLYNGYVKKDERYRDNVVDLICELIRFMVRKQLTDWEVYEYVEIMP